MIETITRSWASLASLLFLFLLIAQFIAYFNFSQMAQVAAVKLGDVLEDTNIGAVWLLIGVIIVTMIVDLIIPAAIAKWALLAPIFIPLFIRLGVAPQTVLAAYRVGDSPVNVITPLMAYFPLIVVFVQRYQKSSGIGTVVSLMLPVRVHPGDSAGRPVLRRLVPDRDTTRPGSTCAHRMTSGSPAHERQHDHVRDSRRRGRALRVGLPARRARGSRRGALALRDGRARSRAGDRGLRRSDGHLHRDAVRRGRGPRLDRRHGLGRSAPDRRGRGEQDATDRADDAAGRRADGADQRQRLGGGAHADGGNARDPPRPTDVAAAAAARVRRPRGVDAHPHRHAGQRDRQRRREERGRRVVRVLRVRARRRPARGRARSRSSCSSASACCRIATARRSRPTSAATRARSRASTGSTPIRARCVTRSSGIAEVVVSPRSDLVGATVYPGMVTDSGDFVVLAVQRRGEALDEATALAAGDALLLRGTWGALEAGLEADPDVLVVDAPELVRRQGVPLGAGAKRAIAVLVGMVILLATGAVPPVAAGLFAAGAIVLLRRARHGSGLPRDLVDDGRARGGHDPALDGDDTDRRRREARRPARRRRRGPRGARTAARALRADCRARPADQQHGDGPDHDPGRALGGGGESTSRRGRS